MESFRPSFYNENPKIHSIELLDWAAAQHCFTAGDLQASFAKELESYKDAVHEVSERIRKLVNSGMIVAIDQTRLDTTSPVAAIDEMRKAAIELRMQILKDESKGRRGRPPRIYIITKTGQNQIQRRAEDIKTIATRRIEEAGQEGLGQA